MPSTCTPWAWVVSTLGWMGWWKVKPALDFLLDRASLCSLASDPLVLWWGDETCQASVLNFKLSLILSLCKVGNFESQILICYGPDRRCFCEQPLVLGSRVGSPHTLKQAGQELCRKDWRRRQGQQWPCHTTQQAEFEHGCTVRTNPDWLWLSISSLPWHMVVCQSHIASYVLACDPGLAVTCSHAWPCITLGSYFLGSLWRK